jgi:hypothetical protein
MRGILIAVLALLLCSPVAGATGATYQNTVRTQGVVTYDHVSGGHVVAFDVAITEGPNVTVARWECLGVASSVGCDLVVPGDHLVINGHLGERLSCHYDDIDNMLLPNLIYRCANDWSSCWLIST